MTDTNNNHSTASTIARGRLLFLAVILSCFSLFAGVLAVGNLVGHPLVQPELQDSLQRARAVLSNAHRQERRKTEAVKMPDGSKAPIPLEPGVDPDRTVRMALSLEVRRQRCLALLSKIHSGSTNTDSGSKTNANPDLTKELQRLWANTQTDLAKTLSVDRKRARITLYALSWPVLGQLKANVDPGKLPGPYEPSIPTLRSLNEKIRNDIMRTLRTTQRKPWKSVSERLTRTYGLNEHQVLSLQAHTCRKKLSHAFRSSSDMSAAREALKRHAYLASFQRQTVLGLRAVQCFLEAGTDAFPVLIQFARNHRKPGIQLLRRAVARNGIPRQAHQAAQNFIRDFNRRTSRRIRALGPFALEAIHQLPSDLTSNTNSDHWKVLSALKNRWGTADNALDLLGDDPDRWAQWYQHARNVL